MIPISNITNERCITTGSPATLADDFVDAQGVFFRADVGGTIKYDPVDNPDGDFIVKTITASAEFKDPVRVKKIYASGTSAQGIYVGKGV